MDDKKGREMAEFHTLTPKGTAKLLVEFKRTGVRGAEEVRPLIRLLLNAGKLQLKDNVLDKLLGEAGES